MLSGGRNDWYISLIITHDCKDNIGHFLSNMTDDRHVTHTFRRLFTAICIGAHTQSQETKQPIITTELPKVEVVATPIPTPEVEMEIEITVPESEEHISEVIEPTSAPEPAISQPATNQSVQAGDMVYVPGFGWFESQGEGTVTYNEGMRENGNKVGIMN